MWLWFTQRSALVLTASADENLNRFNEDVVTFIGIQSHSGFNGVIRSTRHHCINDNAANNAAVVYNVQYSCMNQYLFIFCILVLDAAALQHLQTRNLSRKPWLSIVRLWTKHKVTDMDHNITKADSHRTLSLLFLSVGIGCVRVHGVTTVCLIG